MVTTVPGRGRAQAVERAPYYSAPLPIVALTVAANAATVTAVPRGWARPVARDKEVLDATAVRLITQWFEEGAAGGGKTKCSAATALQRLRALRDPGQAALWCTRTRMPCPQRRASSGSLAPCLRSDVLPCTLVCSVACLLYKRA